jgi:hypothetical protein
MAILTVDSLLGCNSIPNFFQGTADIPSNPTKTIFHNSTAPTSWTKDTTHDNKSLRIIGGSEGSTLNPGGSNPFTSVFASRSSSTGGSGQRTVSFPSSTPSNAVPVSPLVTGEATNNPSTTTSVIFSVDQLPPHTHDITTYTTGNVLTGNVIAPTQSRVHFPTGPFTTIPGVVPSANQIHSHTVSVPHTHPIIVLQHNHPVSTTEHSHPSSSVSADFRIAYVDVIISIKS